MILKEDRFFKKCHEILSHILLFQNILSFVFMCSLLLKFITCMYVKQHILYVLYLYNNALNEHEGLRRLLFK